jgi:hypothetical protein
MMNWPCMLLQWRADFGTSVQLPKIRQLQRAEVKRSKKQRSLSSPLLWCARTCATLWTPQRVRLPYRHVSMPLTGIWSEYALRRVRQIHCCIWALKSHMCKITGVPEARLKESSKPGKLELLKVQLDV